MYQLDFTASNQNALVQKVSYPGIPENILFVLREDLIGAPAFGNKFRKLKYNLVAARKQGKDTLLSFGGAYSNHIVALAQMGNYCGFNTVGIIRGEELKSRWQENPSLQLAAKARMQFKFVTREQYREKDSAEFLEQLNKEYNSPFIIPEGGTNALAIKGCEEILTSKTHKFTHIAAAVGTGGTLAGLINAKTEGQKVMGFSALKGDFLKEEVLKWTQKQGWSITDAYCFGGYGKINEQLVTFINDFFLQTGISLDPLYTGKLFFGLIDLLKRGHFPENSRILAMHTGGIQGIAGMNQKLSKKGAPLLLT